MIIINYRTDSFPFRTSTVFLHEPAAMFSSIISPESVNNILAQAIPALSIAVGRTNVSVPYPDRNYNANEHKYNGWGRDGAPHGNNWLHSDMKAMAYFYTYDLFGEIVRRGGLW